MNCVGENVTQLCGRPSGLPEEMAVVRAERDTGNGTEVKGGMFVVLMSTHTHSGTQIHVVLGTMFQSSLSGHTPLIPETKLKSSPVKTPTF